MARRNRFVDPTEGLSPVASLVRRAARLRRKGDDRQAMLLLKEAAHGHAEEAKLWVLYGVQCTRVGRFDTAVQALNHAVWLRTRAGEHAKARVTRGLIDAAGTSRAA
jgi:predicted TPR repeat methyltransferase